MTYTNAQGKILIATKKVHGKVFKMSTIYIHTDDDTGSIGVLLNSPMDHDMAIKWAADIGWKYPDRIYHGGPVERQLGYVIHSAEYDRETSINLNPALSYTGGRHIVDDINRGIGPFNFCLMTGYCQWEPIQLQNEIEAGMWIVADFDENFFFQELDRESGWESAITVAAENKAAMILNAVDTR
jgi:putative transcriptional regulator